MKKVVISSGFFYKSQCKKCEEVFGMILFISLAMLVVLDHFVNLEKTILLGIFAVAILLAVFFISVAFLMDFILCFTDRTGFEFIFKEQEVFIRGYSSKGDNYFKENINYSSFTKAYLDETKTMSLFTESRRKLIQISLCGVKNKKINEILSEFKKRGILLQISSSLYGLFSIEGEDVYVG